MTIMTKIETKAQELMAYWAARDIPITRDMAVTMVTEKAPPQGWMAYWQEEGYLG